jgi:hypothetical protein
VRRARNIWQSNRSTGNDLFHGVFNLGVLDLVHEFRVLKSRHQRYEPIAANTAIRKREVCEVWQRVVSQRSGLETCSLVPNKVVLEVEICNVVSAMLHHFEKRANARRCNAIPIES